MRLGWVLGVAVSVGVACSAQAQFQQPAPGTVVQVPVETQEWQARREVFLTAVQRFLDDSKDVQAATTVTTMHQAFVKDPVSVTPMEAMDIHGIGFPEPKDYPAFMPQLFRNLAWTATLGWYDALRFAEDSGRAEIISNEGFFKRAFLLNGEDAVQAATDFMTDRPKEAAEAVRAGIAYARTVRHQVHYDTHWPTAYGLSRLSCAMQGGKGCPAGDPLPEAQWDVAFEEAASRVEHYYRINK